MKALSVRQPWAWLIVHGHKPIENRTWRTNVRGQILVHASQGMTRQEYVDCYYFAIAQGVRIPALPELERGGVIGSVEITDCVAHSASPWFFGPYGLTLSNPQTLPFVPVRGALGFFDVEMSDGGAS
jgi:hypothetical protein